MSENNQFNENAAGEAKSADELMAEFDRESNVRQFTGKANIVVKALFLAFAVFVFATRFFTLPEQVRMSAFLGIIMFLGFLIYPSYKKQPTALSIYTSSNQFPYFHCSELNTSRPPT